MPEKNNRNQQPAARRGKRQFDPHWMIQNAESLQRVVKHLDENALESAEADSLLFGGKLLAGPILLTLAVEIALKALLCQEQKKDPPLTHDLLALFKALAPTTRKVLAAQMPGWTDLWFARESPYPHGSLLEVLWQERTAHTYWRYIYEKGWGTCQTGQLDQALTIIIKAYYRRWRDSA